MYTYERKSQNAKPEFTGYMVDEASTIKDFDYNSIHRTSQFNEAMKRFDTEDTMTRSILLSVNEADQNSVMVALSNKLYKHIIDKVDDIDFGTIPKSKGDITKIDNYDQVTDCINILSEIIQQYNQNTEPIDTLSNALQNIIDRTDLFTKAYALNVEMPIVIYNTMVLSIISSVSLMISSCIEFIKLPDDQGFEIALDKVSTSKTMNSILFRDLKKFNKICANGEFDKAMDYVIKQNANNFSGAGFAFGVSGVAVILGIILLIIPIIRELIFFFYYSRTKLSDYFDTQSSLLLINSYNIENNLNKDEKSKKKITNKQRKIADVFKKISNTLKVNNKVGEKKSTNEITKLDKEKYKHDEVLDKIPDSSNSVLF